MSIHKKRRKVEVCHNCHNMLNPDDNFCATCGQENHDLKVGIGQLLYDVFEGITNFDTKFYNTAKAIFLYPGKITKDFLEGRRARYVPPIRLYLLTSFVFFLVFDEVLNMALEKPDFYRDFVDGFIKGVNQDKRHTEGKQDSLALQQANDRHEKKINAVKAQKKLLKAQIEALTLQIDSVKREQDSLLVATHQTKLAQVQKDLERLSSKEKSLKAVKGFIAYVENFDIEPDEILDEMNVHRDDTLRAIIEQLPPEEQRPALLSIQKQMALDTTNTEEIIDMNSDMQKYFTEKIGRNGRIEYTLVLHAIKNEATVKLNVGKQHIKAKGSKGDIKNRAYHKRILGMSNQELDSLILKDKRNKSKYWLFIDRGILRNTTYYQLAFDDDAEKAIRELTDFGVGVISFMMFILMPIVAFLLKMVYSKKAHSTLSYPFRWIGFIWSMVIFVLKFFKKKPLPSIPKLEEGHTRFYYEHLIFSIHIHSIFMMMLLIIVGAGVWLNAWEMAFSLLTFGFMLYFTISLKIVYRQNWTKTIVKSVLLFFMYSFTFLLVLSITGFVKFALQ